MASIRRRTITAPDGTKQKSRKWYIRYKDADGIAREIVGFKDRVASKQLANKLELEAIQKRSGLRDVFAEHRARPLMEHLTDFRVNLEADNVSTEQVKLVCHRCAAILAGCQFTFQSELSASKVKAWLADLRKSGRSSQTSNHYLRAIKQFTRWMVRNRRMPDDPLNVLEMINVKTDRRHVRRALSDAEWACVIETAKHGPKAFNMTGADRAMLYRVAAYTGLRASELASLTTESFDLESSIPVVRVLAGYSKRRREDVLPLHSELLSVLPSWLSTKPAKEPVWPGNWAVNKSAGKMLQVDLKAAGIAYRDEEGRVADFHSLRHTFITRLGRTGVSVQQMKELARHSDVNLTLGVYHHLEIRDAASAIGNLPELRPIESDRQKEVAAATGTNGRLSAVSLPTQLPIATDFPGHFEASVDEAGEGSDSTVSPCSIAVNTDNSLRNEADGVRFELTIPLRGLRFSRPVQSAALPPVRLGPVIVGTRTIRVNFAS